MGGKGAKVNSTPLNDGDFHEVCESLQLVQARWYDIGASLKLKQSLLETIKREAHDSTGAMEKVIMNWLKRNYNVKMFGPPTWKALVEAVQAPDGGDDIALAFKIAELHPAQESYCSQNLVISHYRKGRCSRSHPVSSDGNLPPTPSPKYVDLECTSCVPTDEEEKIIKPLQCTEDGSLMLVDGPPGVGKSTPVRELYTKKCFLAVLLKLRKNIFSLVILQLRKKKVPALRQFIHFLMLISLAGCRAEVCGNVELTGSIVSCSGEGVILRCVATNSAQLFWNVAGEDIIFPSDADIGDTIVQSHSTAYIVDQSIESDGFRGNRTSVLFYTPSHRKIVAIGCSGGRDVCIRDVLVIGTDDNIEAVRVCRQQNYTDSEGATTMMPTSMLSTNTMTTNTVTTNTMTTDTMTTATRPSDRFEGSCTGSLAWAGVSVVMIIVLLAAVCVELLVIVVIVKRSKLQSCDLPSPDHVEIKI